MMANRTSSFPVTSSDHSFSSFSSEEWKTHRSPSPILALTSSSPSVTSSSFTSSTKEVTNPRNGTQVIPSMSSTPVSSTSISHSLSLTEFANGKYVILDPVEASTLYHCMNKETHQNYICKVVPTSCYHRYLTGYLRMNGNPGINSIESVFVGFESTFIVFPSSHGDLHSYVRSQRKLPEDEAIEFFHQITNIVNDCHANGICLRDLKLRKFVFTDPEKTQLKLETLDDAVVLSDADDDLLGERHGCPVYASPEILSSEVSSKYSGRAADCWSLGVILYTMLVGRYPFYDSNPSSLLGKIRRCHFSIPSSISPLTRLVINSLLRRDPEERMTTEDLLDTQLFSREFMQELKERQQMQASSS